MIIQWRRRRSSGWPRLLVGWLARGLALKPGGDACDEDARFYFGAVARDVSSQRYSLSQAGREGRHDTPPRRRRRRRATQAIKSHSAAPKRREI